MGPNKKINFFTLFSVLNSIIMHFYCVLKRVLFVPS